MFKFIYTFSYEEKAKKFLKKHPNKKSQYKKTLELLELNPYHPTLQSHQFTTSSYESCSVSINLSYRISLDFLVSEQEIILVNIGVIKKYMERNKSFYQSPQYGQRLLSRFVLHDRRQFPGGVPWPNT